MLKTVEANLVDNFDLDNLTHLFNQACEHSCETFLRNGHVDGGDVLLVFGVRLIRSQLPADRKLHVHCTVYHPVHSLASIHAFYPLSSTIASRFTPIHLFTSLRSLATLISPIASDIHTYI
jgi:hypothetical protein